MKNAKKITKQEAEQEASFLKKWARGKSIRLQHADATFWTNGKMMTKLAPEMIEALVSFGLATVVREGINGWTKPPKDSEAIASYILTGLPRPDRIGPVEIKMI